MIAFLFVNFYIGLFGTKSSFSGTPWNGVDHNIRDHQSTLVLNPVPLRSAPVNLTVARLEPLQETDGRVNVRQSNGSAFSNYGGKLEELDRLTCKRSILARQ